MNVSPRWRTKRTTGATMADEDEKRDQAVRLPAAMIERADALIPRVQATPWGDAMKWTTAAVVRLALSRGLAALEEELAEVTPTKRARR